jgi:hypothetical protein
MGHEAAAPEAGSQFYVHALEIALRAGQVCVSPFLRPCSTRSLRRLMDFMVALDDQLRMHPQERFGAMAIPANRPVPREHIGKLLRLQVCEFPGTSPGVCPGSRSSCVWLEWRGIQRIPLPAQEQQSRAQPSLSYFTSLRSSFGLFLCATLPGCQCDQPPLSVRAPGRFTPTVSAVYRPVALSWQTGIPEFFSDVDKDHEQMHRLKQIPTHKYLDPLAIPRCPAPKRKGS